MSTVFPHIDDKTHRSTLEQLVNTNKMLVQNFAEEKKRPRNEDNSSPVEDFLRPASDGPGGDVKKLPPLSASDYPGVKFWTRLDWKKHENDRKDSSELESKGSGARGGARSSKGENVMMLYIENADGTPISGTLAGEIRDFARSIWRDFYTRDVAPEKWGDGPKQIRDEFFYEMEGTFVVLRYCDNHWKANAVATSIYSQWYHSFDRKRHAVKSEDVPCAEPPKKKPKTTSKDVEDLVEDTRPSQSEGQPESLGPGHSTNALKALKPRAITLKDPL
jgi:hypothetical protein